MKKTSLNQIHKELDARMVEYAGFEMPVEYKGIIVEHLAVRNSVGIFDVSHMGEIWIKGDDSLNFLQFVTTNNVAKLYNGKAQYSCFPNGHGGLVDDVIIYRTEEKKYMLVVNASNTDKDYNWLVSHKSKYNIEIENSSDKISQLAVQGPKALDVMQKITAFDLRKLKSFEFVSTQVAGINEVYVATTGYTGSGGYELYFQNQYSLKIWNAVFKAGKEYGIQPIGLAARDTLRLEKGFMLYGNDINETTSPLEAGLGWIVDLKKEPDFIDKEFYALQKKNGLNRTLAGFVLIDKGIPRQHYKIAGDKGCEIGEVTSGTMSPCLKKGIGMGYLPISYNKPGQKINILIRDKAINAEIVKMPFC